MIRLADAAKELHLLLGLGILPLASLQLLLLLLIPFPSPFALTAAIAAVAGDAQLGAQYIAGIRITRVQLTETRRDPFAGIGYTRKVKVPSSYVYVYTVNISRPLWFYLRSWATTFWQFISGFLLAPLSKYENLFRSNSQVSSDFILSSVQFYSIGIKLNLSVYHA